MARAAVTPILLLSLTACGRLGFEVGAADAAVEPSDTAPGDVVPASLIHQYSFAGSLADDLGGLPLVSPGGTFLPGGGFEFTANSGVAASNVVPMATYS